MASSGAWWDERERDNNEVFARKGDALRPRDGPGRDIRMSSRQSVEELVALSSTMEG